MNTERTANIPRLSGLEMPSRMSAWYLYYQHFFADLKDIFAAYIKSGDHVFDIGCGNKPDGWRYFSMQDTPFFIFRKARNAKIEMAFKQCTSICCIM